MVPANRYAVFFSIVVLGCGTDLATKQLMFQWLGMPLENPPRWIWNQVVGFETSLNDGALFGLGQGLSPWFAVLSVAAVAAILAWLFLAGAAHDLLLTVALGSVTAGILGNLYDRLGLPGLTWHMPLGGHHVGDPVHAVRDWIKVMIGPWPWPNFNIADSMLVCGAGLLLWHALRHERRGRRAPEVAPP